MFASTRRPHPVTLRLLLVSDVHNALTQVQALGEWVAEARECFDYVMCLGDIADMTQGDREVPERVSAAEGDMSTVLSSLECVQARLVYIPGNHDPLTAFTQSAESHALPRLSPFSFNCHNCRLRLAPTLVVSGVGGSVNGYRGVWEGSIVPYWEAYPWTSDSAVGASVQELLAPQPRTTPAQPCGVDIDEPPPEFPNAVEAVHPDDTVILLTHAGPLGCDTTVDAQVLDDEPIIAGCKSLRSTLEDKSMQDRVLVNLHGHTHAGSGRSWVGKTLVINPGSLREGRFAILTLKLDAHTHKWKVVETTFRVL